MRKTKLIELLNSIEGNPEIVLWNGFVGDYQHISPVLIEEYLTKPTFNESLNRLEYEYRRDRNDWNYELSDQEIDNFRKNYKANYKFEYNEFVTTEDISNKLYNKKRVVFIQPKLRGEKCWDRLGDIRY